MIELRFFVQGVPAPGGSKKAFPLWRKGPGGTKTFVRSLIVDAGGQRNKDWKNNCAWAGREAMLKAGLQPMHGPLDVEWHFTMPRLKSHFRANGDPKPDRPVYHIVKPDTTKLIRSTEDGLSGVVWADDNCICLQKGSKKYGDQPGCLVIVRQIEVI